MEHCGLDGNYRQLVAESLFGPKAVAVLGHYVYWSDVSGKLVLLFVRYCKILKGMTIIAL